jgi:hypothetical protein
MAKPKVRIKSPEELAQETEFYRRMYMSPSIDARRIVDPGGGMNIYLRHHQLGELGSKHEQTRRGKVVQVMYLLPELPPELRRRNPEHTGTR